MLKILKYRRFLEEAELNLQELGKTRNGQPRGNMLVKKLKNDDTLTTNNNKEIHISKMKNDTEWVDVESGIDNIIDPDGNYDIDKSKEYFTRGSRYKDVFKDDNGDEFKLNQLKKTTDFGSSGAGRMSRSFESIQAIFIAIRQLSPNVRLMPENLLNLYDAYIENITEEKNRILYIPDEDKINKEVIANFIKDKNWASTFCNVPNELWYRDTHIDKTNVYAIYQVGYREPSPILTLQNKFKEFAIRDGFKDINFAKWCPADVYMISLDINNKVSDMISNTNNISELTSLCDDLFDNGKFIPLSLKKVSKDSQILIITNKEVDKELPIFHIRKFIIGDDMKGIGSKISTRSIWKYRAKKMSTRKDRNLNLDSSDTNRKQNIDGEVEGSTSRHGKISFNAMKRMIDSKREQVPSMIELQDSKELRSLNIEQLGQLVRSLINEIKRKVRYVEARPISRGSNIEGNEGKLISRIQSLQIVLAMNEMYSIDESMANEVMTKIMRYALSIQTDKFETPRYLRIL